MKSKAEMLAELRSMLHDVLAARAAGSSHPRLSRLQGYVDGYMRAMLEAGQATQEELLSLVAAERAIVNGPATAVVAA
jgi:DNA-binding FrmR family transcriptional regulator